MKIKKIKLDVENTEITYISEASHTVSETILRCNKPRDPEFTKCFQELMPPISKLLELPEHWGL
jgi:hypothetical protein